MDTGTGHTVFCAVGGHFVCWSLLCLSQSLRRELFPDALYRQCLQLPSCGGLAVHSLISRNTWEARKRDQAAFYHTRFQALSSAATVVARKEDAAGAHGMLETLGRRKPSGQNLLLPPSHEL